MFEKLLVQAMNGGVVNECQADVRFSNLFAFQHGAGGFPKLGVIERHGVLLIGDFDPDHDATGSANRVGSASASIASASPPSTSRASAA